MPESKWLFHTCIICDQIRAEINNKATILGFLGVSPHVEIKVNNPDGLIAELTFLFLSHQVTELGRYEIGLSLKSPSGVLLFPMQTQTVVIAHPEGLTLGYAMRPCQLAGTGTYQIALLVNDQIDFESSFSIIRALPGELR